MKKQKLTQEELKRLLNYDPKTGIFVWKIYRNYNAKIGDIAGNTNATTGYINIKINNKSYSAHRLAWLYVYGYFPEQWVDHKNRVRDKNRIKNLREVSPQCNFRNCKVKKNNTSGITGVGFHKRDKKWMADITVDYKRHFLGGSDSLKEAVAARWRAEVKYNFPDCNTTSSAYLYLKSLRDTKR